MLKNFKFKIDWNKGLMAALHKGLKEGMWFHRNGEIFFVPANHISAYFDSSLGMIEIHFYSEKPNTIGTYSIITYRKCWALHKEDLK